MTAERRRLDDVGGALEYATDRMTFTAEASWWRSTFEFSPAISMPYKFNQLRAYVQAASRRPIV